MSGCAVAPPIDDGDLKRSEDALGIVNAPDVEPAAAPSEGTTVLTVTQPTLLENLEEDFGLGAVFAFEEWGVRRSRENNLDFANYSPWYASMATYVDDAVSQSTRGEATSLRAPGGITRRFDSRWLRSRDASFELVALVNRVDRQDFVPETCGELRLIYRLTYQRDDLQPAAHSRMPFTVNVVYDIKRTSDEEGYLGCVEAAQRFTVDRELASFADYQQWVRERFDPLDTDRYTSSRSRSTLR